jgi:hypothetical protein
MHACPVPTDSILRRHFEQLASSAGLPQPPQDSVLLRHYRQLLDARLEQKSAARPAAKAVITEAAIAPASKPNPASHAAAPPVAPPVTTQTAQAPRETEPLPRSSPPPAATGSWFSRLLARIFGN